MEPFATVLMATWSEGLVALRSGAAVREIAEGVVALASDVDGSALAIVSGTSLRRRGPDGGWSTIGTSTCALTACAALEGAIYVGTDDARVLRLEKGGTFAPLESFEHVAGRETWYAGTAIVDGRVVGPPLGVRSMCATCDGSTLLVNVHVGGIPRSSDRGATWHPTIDVEADVHEVAAHPTRPELAAAATAMGLAVSQDGGRTWALDREGLHATHCSAVAFVDDDILVSSATDPFAKEGAVYRHSISQRGLVRVAGLPEWLERGVDTGGIATRGDVVAVADRGGNVHLSGDRGATWQRIAAGLPSPSGLLLI